MSYAVDTPSKLASPGSGAALPLSCRLPSRSQTPPRPMLNPAGSVRTQSVAGRRAERPPSVPSTPLLSHDARVIQHRASILALAAFARTQNRERLSRPQLPHCEIASILTLQVKSPSGRSLTELAEATFPDIFVLIFSDHKRFGTSSRFCLRKGSNNESLVRPSGCPMHNQERYYVGRCRTAAFSATAPLGSKRDRRFRGGGTCKEAAARAHSCNEPEVQRKGLRLPSRRCPIREVRASQTTI